MIRKFMAVLMAAMLLMTGAVFAQEEVNREMPVKGVMTVEEVGEDYIMADGTMLKISESTVIIDSETALPVGIDGIAVGEAILCEYSQMMTRSIPPQTNAFLIVKNADKGGIVNTITADAVETDENGNILVTDNTNDIVVTVTADAAITPYMTRNIVMLSDISVGDKMLMWYDMVTMSIPAYASTNKVVMLDNAVAEEVIEEEINLDAPVKGMLTVAEIGEDYIVAGGIKLMISAQTVMLDSETALPIGIESIAVGDMILCEYSQMMTRSIPPQTQAFLIAKNADKGGIVNTITVDAVETDAEGNVLVTDNANNIIVTITADAEVAPYKTRNIVKLADISRGDKLVLWYDMVTMSIPAQASTNKVIIAENAIPVREVLEGMGYEVKWNGEEMSVELIKEDVSAKIMIDSAMVEMDDKTVELPARVALVDSKTYVPETLIALLSM